MNFKMYGKYKYDLDTDMYLDSDGNTLEINEVGKTWVAKFSKYDTILEGKTFEEIDVKIEDFIYSQKTIEEKIETFPKPPLIDKETVEKMILIKTELEKK